VRRACPRVCELRAAARHVALRDMASIRVAVRLAVGAQRSDVRRSVLWPAFWRLVPGMAFGVLAVVLGTRAMRHICLVWNQST
jgi:hypothetical protein